MLDALRDIVKHFEELEKHEVNTPVKLRPVLRFLDASNTIPYAQSFVLHICDSIYKGNIDFCEKLSKIFLKEYSDSFMALVKNEQVVYPDLLSLTKKGFHQFIKGELTKLITSPIKSDFASSIIYKAISNKRTKQEDRYFGVWDIFNYSMSHECHWQKKSRCPLTGTRNEAHRAALLGLFDGHNGPEASEHCHRLAPHLVSQQLQSTFCETGRCNYLDALADTVHSLNFNLNGCRNRYRWRAGTTCTLSLVTDDTIYTAWVGDSSGWVVFSESTNKTNGGDTRDCEPDLQIPLTDVLHRPTERSEVVDVWNQGGIVTKCGHSGAYDRVNGVLAVTRALGDDRKIPGVSPLPSVSQYCRTGRELCLVLASDGLWDSDGCDGASVGNLCRHHLDGERCRDPASQQALCQALVDAAVAGGASDNITIVLLLLDEDKTVIGSRSSDNQKHTQDQRRVVHPRRQRHLSGFCEELSQPRRLQPSLRRFLEARFSSDVRMLKSLEPLVSSGQPEYHRHSSRRRRALSASTNDLRKRYSSPLRHLQ